MSNIEKILDYLPNDYEAAAKTCGAIQRTRQIKTGKDLMLLCLNYLLKGLTLAEVAVFAAIENIANISDVGFMKRFAKCGEWFKHIAKNLEFPERVGYKKPSVFDKFRIIAVDASDILQRGKLKLEFHLHYAYDIFTMCTVEYKFTNNKVGETLLNFSSFKMGDLIIADRAYGTICSILHCLASGADYVFRLRHNAFFLYDIEGKPINLNEKLSEASETESVDFVAHFKKGETFTPVRICAIKKDPEAICKSQQRTKRRELRKQTTYSAASKRMDQYIVIATSLSSDISAMEILELYRYRWQIELFFKRAKSLLQLGNLPNKKEENIMAWLDGKMLCAFLLELIEAEVDFFPQDDARA